VCLFYFAGMLHTLHHTLIHIFLVLATSSLAQSVGMFNLSPDVPLFDYHGRFLEDSFEVLLVLLLLVQCCATKHFLGFVSPILSFAIFRLQPSPVFVKFVDPTPWSQLLLRRVCFFFFFFFFFLRALYPVGYLYGFHAIDKICRDK